MSQHSTPYAVPAVGMRKVLICPVCGDAFLATPQHRWIAYIPRMRAEKLVCSYHCMREMERKLGRWQSIRFIEPEEAENREKTALQSTEQMSLSELRRKKRELEEQLDRGKFVRISNGEIINLDKVTAVDLSLTGTIRMTLTGGVTVYVSRRYVKKIREVLGL